jgi:hypothetical protein
MLLRSGLPKHFWLDAYLAACHITLRLPTRTGPRKDGCLSPFECCPGRSVPSLGRLRVWGCKAYVFSPKADRRKDWEEKAQTGVFIACSDSKQGWTVWLPEYDKAVTSVHVLFDEQPPSRPKKKLMQPMLLSIQRRNQFLNFYVSSTLIMLMRGFCIKPLELLCARVL